MALLFANVAKAQLYMIEKFSLSATDREYGMYADINSQNTDQEIYFDWESPNGYQQVRTKMSFKNSSLNPAVNNSEVEKFISALEQAKKKFEEWSATSKTKSLALLTHGIPVYFSDHFIFFSQKGTWYSEKGVDIKAVFYVSRAGKCFLILETDYMESDEVVAQSSAYSLSYTGNLRNFAVSSGYSEVVVERYCPGASLAFSSSTEIDDFIAKLRSVVEWKLKNVESGKLLE